MIALFFAALASVFLAEVAGDKLMYTTGILSTRFEVIPVVEGMAAAFMVKMAVAVALGEAIARLPRGVIVTITSASFVGIAFSLWRRPDSPPPGGRAKDASRAALISFSAILFSEWGDVGQLTAATLAARYSHPVVIWSAAVSAMVLKGALAGVLGARARRWLGGHLSPRAVRYGGVGLILTLGLLSVAESIRIWR